ncbi:MAG TPA: glycosyltransferase [Longimicrobium sp.]|jgi:glycosyltransferase involved in cell wall biosynthesis|uniref:glycosyltransferase n=1 Tax=Longimicrobium sp. TaxID=2029185 RepID=UPI002ED9D54C
MKVAMHVDGVEFRGSEKQTLLIATGLRDRGHAVVVSLRGGGPVEAAFRAEGLETTTVRPRGDADVLSGLAFVAWLRRERPDAALLTSWVRLFGASLAARAAGVPRIVQRIGGVQDVPAAGASGWKYRRGLLKQIDQVIVNSPGLAESFGGQVPGLAGRIHVVPNAVTAVPATPAPVRAEIGAAADDVLLLAAGGLERRKGFDLLIRAFDQQADRRVRLLVAGSGPAADALAMLAREHDVADRVHFLGQRGDLPGLLAAADAFVLSSRRDSMANVMLEAMAAALPVLATDVPGTAQALAPGGGRPPAGWIVARGDADTLAAGLRVLLADLRAGGGEARARAAEARWRIGHWFTAERMVDGYEAVLAGKSA